MIKREKAKENAMQTAEYKTCIYLYHWTWDLAMAKEARAGVLPYPSMQKLRIYGEKKQTY